MVQLSVVNLEGDKHKEWMHVAKHHSITACLRRLNYQDINTRQYVMYIPSLEVSGYGDTWDKAFEMLKFSVSECFRHFSQLSKKELEAELRQLGWRKHWLKNKDYSHAYVDVGGQLKEFAVEGNVEEELIEAA